ncbi:MAG: hypothetical protein ACK501_13330 [Planctomycetota bacterium]|jgi:hypothetical protein
MTEKENTGRDAQGRFTQGNPGGPGGARRRPSALQRAAEEAVTPELVQAMMRKATRLALEGNLSAMRLVLERTAGRPPEAPVDVEPIGIALPKLQTAANCNTAIEMLFDGIVKGTVDREAAKLLIDTVQTRLRVLEVTDLEARLAELERLAETHAPRDGRRS